MNSRCGSTILQVLFVCLSSPSALAQAAAADGPKESSDTVAPALHPAEGLAPLASSPVDSFDGSSPPSSLSPKTPLAVDRPAGAPDFFGRSDKPKKVRMSVSGRSGPANPEDHAVPFGQRDR